MAPETKLNAICHFVNHVYTDEKSPHLKSNQICG